MRPSKQGEAITQQDVGHLLRILRRVSSDPKRAEKDRKQLKTHLTALIALLVSKERNKVPVTKGGGISKQA
jgi:hypothetical protein